MRAAFYTDVDPAAIASLAFAREKPAVLDVAVLEKPFDLEQLRDRKSVV